MNEMEQEKNSVSGIVGFEFVLRICFLSGAVLGALVAPFYAYSYLMESDFLAFVGVIALTPVANGIFVAVYGAAGYPVYKYLAVRGKLGFGNVPIQSNRA